MNATDIKIEEKNEEYLGILKEYADTITENFGISLEEVEAILYYHKQRERYLTSEEPNSLDHPGIGTEILVSKLAYLDGLDKDMCLYLLGRVDDEYMLNQYWRED